MTLIEACEVSKIYEIGEAPNLNKKLKHDIEVVVEGRLGADGVFHATDVLAKCGSRYEATPEASPAA